MTGRRERAEKRPGGMDEASTQSLANDEREARRENFWRASWWVITGVIGLAAALFAGWINSIQTPPIVP